MRNLAGCCPICSSIRGAWPRIFIFLPAAAVPTESCGMGSNCEASIPRAVIVWGEMTLAKVFPLSTKALTANFPSRTGTYAL